MKRLAEYLQKERRRGNCKVRFANLKKGNKY